MGFLGMKSPGDAFVTVGTLGLNKVLGEDTMSKIPGLNAIGGYQSDADKALIEKQKQLAEEAKRREEANAQARLQALGQSMLAFNPRNQMMAQMFGPEAAFSPEQFAQMGSDPMAKPIDQANAAWLQAKQRNPNNIPPEIQADLERARENERRKRQLQQGMQPLPAGPTPLARPMAPQGARRF
jgi:hypothetical protein